MEVTGFMASERRKGEAKAKERRVYQPPRSSSNTSISSRLISNFRIVPTYLIDDQAALVPLSQGSLRVLSVLRSSLKLFSLILEVLV